MRYGIPGYRTPRDMLDAEIKRIIDMGVEVRLNSRVGNDVTVAELEKRLRCHFLGHRRAEGPAAAGARLRAPKLPHRRRVPRCLQPWLGVLDRQADRRRRRWRHVDRRGVRRPPSRPCDDTPSARRGGPRRGRLHRSGRGGLAPARGRAGHAHFALSDRQDDGRRARARGRACARASTSRAA